MTFPSAHTSSSVSYLLYQVFLSNNYHQYLLLLPSWPSFKYQHHPFLSFHSKTIWVLHFLVLSLPSLLKPLWSDFCQCSVMEFDSMFLYWWQLLSLTPFPPNPGELIRKLTCSLLWCPWVFQTWPYFLVIIKTNKHLPSLLSLILQAILYQCGRPALFSPEPYQGSNYFFIPSWYV